jgi:N-acetylglutamate synthase-like GNAT family acetyltransferase
MPEPGCIQYISGGSAKSLLIYLLLSQVQVYKKGIMEITYRWNLSPRAEDIIELYDLAALPRPTKDIERIKKMFDNSALIITAWHEERLVGISRCLTDWVWTCYLADLAVHPAYQGSGIGKRLIELTKERAGEQCMILLLSVPAATEYYPKVGFTKFDNSFIINRSV